MKPAHGAVVSIVAAAAITLGVSQTATQPDTAKPTARIIGVSKAKPDPAPKPSPAPAPIPLPAPIERVTIVEWIDGDTCHALYRAVVHSSVEIAMPWSPKRTIAVQLDGTADIPVVVRCYGLNAPESQGATKAAGLAARDYARKIAPEGSTVSCTFRGQEKYGRALCELRLPNGNSFASEMISAGRAVEYCGGAR